MTNHDMKELPIKTLAINSQSNELLDQIIGWQSALLLACKLKPTSIKLIHFCNSDTNGCTEDNKETTGLSAQSSHGSSDKSVHRSCHHRSIQLGQQQLNLLSEVGISEKKLFETCSASNTLGRIYKGWSNKAQHFALVNGEYGVNYNGVEFQHYLTTVNDFVQSSHFDDYALAALMAKTDKFVHPISDKRSILSSYDYAVNVDACQYLALIRNKALTMGVEACCDVKVTAEAPSKEMATRYDFLINCVKNDVSKTAKLKNAKNAKKVQKEKSYQLFIADLPFAEPVKSATIVQAYSFGYTVLTQLQSKCILQCVYHENTAIDDVLSVLSTHGVTLDKSQLHIEQHEECIAVNPWQDNTLLIGTASFHGEPLVDDVLGFVHHDIELFLKNFPRKSSTHHVTSYYNQIHNEFYQHVTDFVSLHYFLCERSESAFWQERTLSSLDSEFLSHFITVFKKTGVIVQCENQYMNDKYWRNFLMGFDYRPEGYDPLIDKCHSPAVIDKLDHLKKQIAEFADKLPSYHQYLKSQGL